MRKFALILVLSLGLLACQPEDRVYTEHQKLSPDVEWLKKDVREFQVPIQNLSIAYNLSLSFRYANGYQFQTANVRVTETSPSGEVKVNEYELKIREDNGEYIGDAGYDIWDSEHLVEPSKRYSETGIYKYVIEHVMPVDPLNYAMEIGIVLDKII